MGRDTAYVAAGTDDTGIRTVENPPVIFRCDSSGQSAVRLNGSGNDPSRYLSGLVLIPGDSSGSAGRGLYLIVDQYLIIRIPDSLYVPLVITRQAAYVIRSGHGRLIIRISRRLIYASFRQIQSCDPTYIFSGS